MLATRHATDLLTLCTVFPRSIAAVLVTPYLYLNDSLREAERALTVAKAEELTAKGITEKVILRS